MKRFTSRFSAPGTGKIGKWQAVSGLVFWLVCAQAWAVNLGIESDADYDKLLPALRAAEYVRSDFIPAEAPNNRVYASLAAVMAYSERNPNASSAQLEAFLNTFELGARTFSQNESNPMGPCNPNGPAACDPQLNDPATFIAALRFLIISNPVLAGTDTDVGARALMLLGVAVPDPNGFESINRRMVEYEMALARPLAYRNEIFDLLVAGFFGVDLAGNERPELPFILDTYFESQGYDPEFGTISPDEKREGINQALATMPADFDAYELAISDSPENADLRGQVESQLEQIRLQTNSIVDISLVDAVANAPGIAQSAFPSDELVAQVLQERREDLAASNRARAESSAATLLMLQSENDAIGDYASYTRSYGQLSLETNASATYFKAGVQIAGSLLGAGIGQEINDPTAIIGGLASATSLGLDLMLDTPDPAKELTFTRLSALRGQIQQMQFHMNARFNRIDQKLNIMYDTITTGLGEITVTLNRVDDNVEGLVEDMAAAQSQLRRLEQALYNVAQDILINDLAIETDQVIDYFDSTGSELAYAGEISFLTALSKLLTFATTTSTTSSFAGDYAATPDDLLTDASTGLTNDIALSAFLNPLAVLPHYKFGFDRNEYADPGLPGIEPWSQAGSAYAQIGRENPWYLSYLYGVQVQNNANNGAEPDLDQIIRKGERIVSFVEAIRKTEFPPESDLSATGSNLFDALIENYKGAVNEFQAAIDAQRTPQVLASALTTNCEYRVVRDSFNNDIPRCVPVSGGLTLDLWSSDRQEDLIRSLVGFRFQNSGGSYLFSPGDASQQGLGSLQSQPFVCDDGDFCGLMWNTWTDGTPESDYWLRLWYLTQEANGVSAENLKARYAIEGTTGLFRAYFWIGGIGTRTSFPPWKQIIFAGRKNDGATDNNMGIDVAEALFLTAFNSPEFAFNKLSENVISQQRSVIGTFESNDGGAPAGLTLTTLGGFSERLPFVASDVLPGWYEALSLYRKQFHSHILNELAASDTDLQKAAKKVDDAVALLNAYATIGLPKELEQSQLLRAALRLPGSEPGVGDTTDIRLGALAGLVLDIDSKDRTDDFADPDFNINKVTGILHARADIVAAEIKLALQKPVFAPDYVGFVLSELRHLRSTAFDLAVDDAYITEANGTLNVAATAENTGPPCGDSRWTTGLLGNDANQGCNDITIDTSFTPAQGYIAPSGGTVSIQESGSFTYQANASFSGTDSFTYRAKTIVDGNMVFSNVANVVITVENEAAQNIIITNGFEGGVQ